MRYFGFLSVLSGLISFILIFIFIPNTNLLITSLLYSVIGIKIILNNSNDMHKSSDINKIISWSGYFFLAMPLIIILVYSWNTPLYSQAQLQDLSFMEKSKEVLLKNPIHYILVHKIGEFGLMLITSFSFIISNYIFNSLDRPRLTKRQKPILPMLYNGIILLMYILSLFSALILIISIYSSITTNSISLLDLSGKIGIAFILSIYLAMDFSKRESKEY